VLFSEFLLVLTYLSKLNLIIFIFRVFVAKVLLPPSQNGVKDEADRQ
jgi:hypothetical protein